jgi:peptide/nickel transport system substrate-binding protein
MRRNNIYRIIFIILAGAVTLFACSRDNNASKTATELRYGFTSEPATLDPLSSANTADGRSVLFNVFEGLVKPDTEGRLQPCLAESWTIERDALVYNFKIRENVHFHDGSVLTADDVKFSLETAITAGFQGVIKIEKIEVNGSYVKITLKESDPDLLPYMTIGIVRAGSTDRENNINGTGPFSIESYTPQQNLVLKKFDDYWLEGKPHLDKVTLVFFANSDAQMVALLGGSIDGANVVGTQVSQIDNQKFDVFNSYSASVQLMAFNNALAPFDDIRVRRAVNYGIDTQNIIDTAFFGMGSPSGSPLIPGLSDYYEKSLSYNYSPNIARSLLSEAGYNENRKLAFEITVPSNYTMHVDTAQVIVSQLEKIGVNASIKLIDWSSWLTDTYRGRNYQATIISLDGYNVSPRSYLSRYLSDNGSNFMNFNNDVFDRVYNAALSETDTVQRIRLYKETQRIITENAAAVYIQDINYPKVFRAGAFSGIFNYPLYVIDFASIYGIKKS